MHPFIAFWDIRIYIFWVFLIIAWLVFFYCLQFFSQKQGIVKPIFSDIFTFTLVIFLVSRFFYILSEWRDSQFIFQDFFSGDKNIGEFLYYLFISHDYNLSFFGGILGFIFVFFIKTQKWWRGKYLDIIIPSFLIAGIFGYIWSVFGGQVYGIPFDSIISIDYNTKFSEVPTRTLLFPLPILYILWHIWLLFLWRKLEKLNTPSGYTGFILLGLLGVLLFIWEFFNGNIDIFSDYIRLNHLLGTVFIWTSFVWIIKFLRS